MAQAYSDYTKGYLPQTKERHDAVLASQKVVNALNIAWMNNGLSYAQYTKALEDLEAITGVHWS